ncbi:hypothetical protein [Capnocytophaga sp.]|uniref:hypothetical protein n=1 Tax=Capnocytophaga sp. TaxID=44737 RepID=UPI0026DC4AB3|nr:hypothetical protein [Capnocytophaga sp.]MDO5104442.1 hypothetical protein [Capnocytophaga sp.]
MKQILGKISKNAVPIAKIVASVYVIYIFIVEKHLRRHSPLNLDTILMLITMLWLVNEISKGFKAIKASFKSDKKSQR